MSKNIVLEGVSQEQADLKKRILDKKKDIKVKIRDIKVGKNPRKEFNAKSIEELAQSIKSDGLLQPILLDKDLKLIAGERRLRAFKLLKEKEIPAIIYSGKTDTTVLAVVENIQRDDLTPLEVGHYCYQLRQKHKKKTDDIAQLLNKSKGWVSQVINFYLDNKDAKNPSKSLNSHYKKNNSDALQFAFRWKLSKKAEGRLTANQKKSLEKKLTQMEKLKEDITKIVNSVN